MDLGSGGIVLSVCSENISCMENTAKQICTFVFAYAKSRFSQDVAHFIIDFVFYIMNDENFRYVSYTQRLNTCIAFLFVLF